MSVRSGHVGGKQPAGGLWTTELREGREAILQRTSWLRPAKAYERRDIRVCVLNHSASPVPEALIRQALSAVSQEYRDKVGIAFETGDILPYSGDLTAWPIDLGIELKNLCPAETELRMIFTNQRMFRKDMSSPAEQGAGTSDDEFAAASHVYFGFLVLYNVEERFTKRDAAGNPALATALKHEVGHLFGLEHSPDTRSFMYTPSSRSTAEWTEETLRAILKNRDKRWFPRA